MPRNEQGYAVPGDNCPAKTPDATSVTDFISYLPKGGEAVEIGRTEMDSMGGVRYEYRGEGAGNASSISASKFAEEFPEIAEQIANCNCGHDVCPLDGVRIAAELARKARGAVVEVSS